MENGYISEELKKVPASQYDIEKLSHKIDKLFNKVDNVVANRNCLLHSSRIDDIDGRVTWIEKKIWMGIGGLAVLQITIAFIMAMLNKGN